MSNDPVVSLSPMDLCVVPPIGLPVALPLLPSMTGPPINPSALIAPGSVGGALPLPLLDLSAQLPISLPAPVPPRFPQRTDGTGESADERLAKLGLSLTF